MIVVYMGLCILIAALEAPGLIRRRHYGELIVFMGLLLIGFMMGLGFFLKWPLSAPFEAMVSYFGR